MSEIFVDIKFSNDLKYISFKEIKILKLVFLIKSFFSVEFDKLSEAFSTNKCGFGKGLNEIFPLDLRYILKFL